MASREEIKVYVEIVNGKTVCICKRDNKGCDKYCQKDVVTRDKFAGWEDTFRRDRYGKCKGEK